MSTGPVLLARGLGRRFDRREALSGLDLSLEAGEVFGLLGPNGAGKSTTLNLLKGFLRPTAGTATIREVRALLAEHAAGGGTVVRSTHLLDAAALPAFVAGLLAGFLMDRSGRLDASLALHVVSNTLAMVGVLLGR